MWTRLERRRSTTRKRKSKREGEKGFADDGNNKENLTKKDRIWEGEGEGGVNIGI